MLQIFLKGPKESGFLDLLPGTELDIESYTDLFDEDLAAGEFSLPIDIPWTDNNRRLMGFIERLNNGTTARNYWECDVLDNGYPEIQRAKLQLQEKSGNLNFTSGKFSASISGTKGLFGSKIKNQKLRSLQLGGAIAFTEECRDFATNHAKGMYPQYDRIGFAPVAIENFFDTSKSYTDEFLVKDTVNYIVRTGGGINDWQFGRPTSTNTAIATLPGNPEHINYRTIPFYKFKYVVQQIFAENGYTVTGEMIGNTLLDDVYIFNTTALEFYSIIANADYTRKIFPADHVPDVLVSDFLRAALAFLNIYPVFSATGVELRFREKVFANKKVMNITGIATPEFTDTYSEETDKTGYTVDYEWDGNDDYRNDRVKDITTKTFVATVATLPNLATLNIGRPFTTDDIAFVAAENMYYNVANATTTPVLWDAWSERLGEYKIGDGNNSYKIGMATLCNYVELDAANALYVRRNMLGCRQSGSYTTNKLVKVKNDFSLRVFFIKKQLIAGNEIPVSMNNDTTANGTLLNPFSMALEGSTGLLQKYFTNWLQLKENKETIKLAVLANKKILAELRASNTVQLNNVLYLLAKLENKIPVGSSIELELKLL